MSLYDDAQFAWKLGTLWIPAAKMAGMLSKAGVDTSEGNAGAAHGASTLAASELTCVPMTTGDEVYHFMPIPTDWDMENDIRARIVFVHAAAAADTGIDWGLIYAFYAAQAALTDCRVTNDGTVVFAAHTASVTDDSIEVTPWKSLATTTNYASGDIAWAFAIDLTDDGETTGDECELMGIEFQYVRKLLSDGERETT